MVNYYKISAVTNDKHMTKSPHDLCWKYVFYLKSNSLNWFALQSLCLKPSLMLFICFRFCRKSFSVPETHLHHPPDLGSGAVLLERWRAFQCDPVCCRRVCVWLGTWRHPDQALLNLLSAKNIARLSSPPTVFSDLFLFELFWTHCVCKRLFDKSRCL